jgi:GNAT superfamily N-acetyltransferase
MLPGMDVTLTGFEALTERLPAGYRAREFRDSDREAMVEDRNAERHELQQGTADEWRDWEKIDPPVDLFRLVVETSDGRPAAMVDLGPGFIPRPDGTVNGSVGVAREHRKKGLGNALLEALEAEARRRQAPRILSGTVGDLEWAHRRGYREIGRRIESYVYVQTFDPSPFTDVVERVRASGVELRSLPEVLAGRDAMAIERFWRELYDAEAPMWDDVPWATPTPHWAWDKFRKMMVESGKIVPDATIIAFAGDTIAGYTSTGRSGTDRGFTYMTGTGRAHRGQGLGTALKVKMLAGAKNAGLRAMLTTNDEPNKAMRGINAKLGYVMLPAHIELEKKL